MFLGYDRLIGSMELICRFQPDLNCLTGRVDTNIIQESNVIGRSVTQIKHDHLGALLRKHCWCQAQLKMWYAGGGLINKLLIDITDSKPHSSYWH